ncbi:monosaccharide ABC transporter ATP-binding protein (CUT2 family) [Hydrogenispora ethanolica]|uniref:Monosaccharide ABC transporter ATP-binding protein (CUT2 family) n=1 Tax=Hydrogenispora ethanolica TaxID=1082276 RepID=A0A4R1RK21_HYDET|nr:sugar ABC transporter ATP-binding protein [Hydrogenispora ethanolica]TCL66514.1 monosaccharide ABC transporter ATP-binding protein (CUT2 family) [Hydrogenispora ethanolica]
MACGPILRLEGVCKSFPGVQALNHVSFDVLPGEIHVLMGENGAGKSTLIKIISGVYQADQGSLFVDERPVRISSPKIARELGISTVYQELTLTPALSVAENIFMGRLPRRRNSGFVDWAALYRQTRTLLDTLAIDLDPRELVGNLSVGYRQQIEIARALSLQAKLIILDEPTAVLTDEESSKLFRNMQLLKERKVGMIYISHRMAEVLNLADRITVMRDGGKVATIAGSEANYDELVRLMVGRNIDKNRLAKHPVRRDQPFLEVDNLSQSGVVQSCSFKIYPGEILGVYGLVGSGRTELARLLFGLEKSTSGSVKLNGTPLAIRCPRDAIRAGFGFLPEERRRHGLVLKLDVSRNINLANHEYLQSGGFVRAGLEKSLAEQGVRELAIKTPNLRQLVENLSGGNQQKVILARWLTHHPQPQILILDEPTRGVDVGAKAEIHRLIKELARQGMTVLMISSDMPEVLTVSDRIMVMREGGIVGEMLQEEATEEKIIFLAAHHQVC